MFVFRRGRAKVQIEYFRYVSILKRRLNLIKPQLASFYIGRNGLLTLFGS